MVNKKAFMKTIEILLVIILSTIFLLVILPKQQQITETKSTPYLIYLEKDADFREFIQSNTQCYNSSSSEASKFIRRYLPQELDYILCSGTKTTNLPEKNVFVDSLFFSGNISNVEYKIIRLYYWSK